MSPAAFTLAGKQVSPENQGKATALAESCFGIGTMFGPSIGGFLFDIGGFPLPFWLFGGFAVFIAIACLFVLKDVSEAFQEADTERDVTWSEVLTAPGTIFLRIVETLIR